MLIRIVLKRQEQGLPRACSMLLQQNERRVGLDMLFQGWITTDDV